MESITSEPRAKFVAGGTNLVDLMREGIERPETVIDITRLPLDGIEELADGRLRIGGTGAQQSPGRGTPDSQSLSGSVPGDPAWRLRAASEYGDGRGHAETTLVRILRDEPDFDGGLWVEAVEFEQAPN
jgi:hypothetical protein